MKRRELLRMTAAVATTIATGGLALADRRDDRRHDRRDDRHDDRHDDRRGD